MYADIAEHIAKFSQIKERVILMLVNKTFYEIMIKSFDIKTLQDFFGKNTIMSKEYAEKMISVALDSDNIDAFQYFTQKYDFGSLLSQQYFVNEAILHGSVKCVKELLYITRNYKSMNYVSDDTWIRGLFVSENSVKMFDVIQQFFCYRGDSLNRIFLFRNIFSEACKHNRRDVVDLVWNNLFFDENDEAGYFKCAIKYVCEYAVNKLIVVYPQYKQLTKEQLWNYAISANNSNNISLVLIKKLYHIIGDQVFSAQREFIDRIQLCHPDVAVWLCKSNPVLFSKRFKVDTCFFSSVQKNDLGSCEFFYAYGKELGITMTISVNKEQVFEKKMLDWIFSIGYSPRNMFLKLVLAKNPNTLKCLKHIYKNHYISQFEIQKALQIANFFEDTKLSEWLTSIKDA